MRRCLFADCYSYERTLHPRVCICSCWCVSIVQQYGGVHVWCNSMVMCMCCTTLCWCVCIVQQYAGVHLLYNSACTALHPRVFASAYGSAPQDKKTLASLTSFTRNDSMGIGRAAQSQQNILCCVQSADCELGETSPNFIACSYL